jgi:hypothetical protein
MRTNYICSARIGEPRAGTHRTSNPAVSSGNNSVSANAGFGSKSAAQAGPVSLDRRHGTFRPGGKAPEWFAKVNSSFYPAK